LFVKLKKEDPNFLDKAILMEGDCALPNLGLSEQSRQTLLNEVNCLFHRATNLRFNKKIPTAMYIVVRATIDILMLSKNMENLKIHTCLPNRVAEEIEEGRSDVVIVVAAVYDNTADGTQ
ncbi:hypothetical protein ILUMI_00257, partial [Ignelater luminosus]